MFYDVDFHIHTDFSDGEGSVREVLEFAQKKGLRAIAITDHFEPEEASLEQEKKKLLEHFKQIDEISKLYNLKVYKGCEVEATFHVSEELRRKTDLIIRSIHSFPMNFDFSKFSMFDQELWSVYKNEILQLLKMQHTDIAGHIMGYFPLPADWIGNLPFDEKRALEKEIRQKCFDTKWMIKVIELARVNNVALEIHNPTQAPDLKFVREAVSRGVKLSLGSDAHLLSWVGRVDFGKGIFERLKLTEKNLFWPGDG
jgi:putative hydrolase